MKRTGDSQHQIKVGTSRKRAVWIPLISLGLGAGLLMLRGLHEDPAPAAAAMLHAASALNIPTPETGGQLRASAEAAGRDPAIVAHEALDPVGAGHDVVR